MFYLWTFGDYDKTVTTRGRTQQEAFIHASKNWGRGEAITLYPFNPIWAGREYSKNHAEGWLNRPPYWLTHMGDKMTLEEFLAYVRKHIGKYCTDSYWKYKYYILPDKSQEFIEKEMPWLAVAAVGVDYASKHE